MSLLDIVLLGVAGIVAGVANTIAGGGSLLAIPILVLGGVPATTANGTIRPALVFQNLFALFGFWRGGVLRRPGFWRRALLLGLCSLPGTWLGAWLVATRISDAWFERILGAVMLGILWFTWRRRGGGRRQDLPENVPLAALLFVGIGFYGGFVQAGVGFLIMAALLNTTRLDLAAINALKIVVVLIYTPLAICVFESQGQVAWAQALVLIVSQSAGGYLGSWLTVRAGDRVLMRAYAALLLVFAVVLFC